MRHLFMDHPRVNKWLAFSAVSLAFFFLNLSTFTSLGVVLYTMVAELHWTMTAAGFSFSVLGLACGLSGPLPAGGLERFGGRTPLCLGCGPALRGVVSGSAAHTIAAFAPSVLLVGVRCAWAGEVPGG